MIQKQSVDDMPESDGKIVLYWLYAQQRIIYKKAIRIFVDIIK